MSGSRHPIEARTVVAFDLETSGLRAGTDKIIEFGAVKFVGGKVVDSLSQLINPGVQVDKFVTQLTGIAQEELDNAPPLEEVLPQIVDFISGCELVAHNARFDLGFLKSTGIDVQERVYDTLEIAHVLLWRSKSYGLGNLAKELEIELKNHHRALNDADATRLLFQRLMAELMQLSQPQKRLLAHIGSQSDWALGALAQEALPADETVVNYGEKALERDIHAAGIDPERATARTLQPHQGVGTLPEDPGELSDLVDSVYAADGLLGTVLSGFTHREGQAAMASAVTESLLNGERIVIEAGTGIGKSLAYLIPSVLHCLSTRTKLVISTYSLTLQEQLLNKDVPIVDALLEHLSIIKNLNCAVLKGKGNYLCAFTWRAGLNKPPNTSDEAAFLAKMTLWMSHTETGDRSEINLGIPRNHYLFSRYSAATCTCATKKRSRPCFLQKARRNAAAADVVIVNHSLLVANAVHKNNQPPQHGALVIDEAHHLADVATDQLSFRINQREFNTLAENCLDTKDGLVQRTSDVIAKFAPQNLEDLLAELGKLNIPKRSFEAGVAEFFTAHGALVSDSDYRVRVDRRLRAKGEWQEVVQGYQAFLDGTLNPLGTLLRKLTEVMEGLIEESIEAEAQQSDVELPDETLSRINQNSALLKEMADNLGAIIASPRDDFVYWLERATASGAGDGLSMCGAPIEVNEFLGEQLFVGDTPAVLTGATLSIKNSLEQCKLELGLEEAQGQIIKQDFDFRHNTAVICLTDAGNLAYGSQYQGIAECLAGVVEGAGGRVLALFTSKTSMNGVYAEIATLLRDSEHRLVAQGRDGNAQMVLQELQNRSQILAMGVSSLWEGVDLGNANLNAVVVTKLPFPVPNDPLHAARAERYQDGFNHYFVPQAVKRFKQGFGRLIRTHKSRGVFVVLDSRVLKREYGRHFLEALPEEAPKWNTTSSEVGGAIRNWFEQGAGSP